MDTELKEYLDMVKQTVQPTLEEEKEMAALILSGREATAYIEKLERKYELGLVDDLEGGKYQDQIQSAKEKIKKAIEAKQQLVVAFLSLATFLVQKYGDKDIPMMDQLQEANVTLLWAVENWNCEPEEDRRFSAYAETYIKGALIRMKAKKSIVYIPAVTDIGVRRVALVSRTIEAITGQEATLERAAAELNIPLALAKKLFEMGQAWKSRSLDEPLTIDSEEKDPTLASVVPADPEVYDPTEIVNRRTVKRTVIAVLASLEPDEEKVIRCRFGFVDGNPHEAEEVAHACGMTLQEEQVIEVRAMRRLRHPSRSLYLRGLL